jgi:hypothetical protein
LASGHGEWFNPDTDRYNDFMDGKRQAFDCLSPYEHSLKVAQSRYGKKKRWYPDLDLIECVLNKINNYKYRYGRPGDCCFFLGDYSPDWGANVIDEHTGGFYCCSSNPNSSLAFYCHDGSIMLCERLFHSARTKKTGWPFCHIARFIIHELVHVCRKSTQRWEFWHPDVYGEENPADRAAFEVLACCPACNDYAARAWGPLYHKQVKPPRCKINGHWGVPPGPGEAGIK